jgi:CMP-N,N'-diacetyllegionaminic acid synthase
MIRGRSLLAIIPARGGSKEVPRKNLREIAGKPLIAWAFEEGRKSQYLDRLILSSEDPEIIAVARAWGCEVPFVRPAELARDETPGIELVLHALNALPERYDYVVLLQPTSPLRLAEDIDGCVETCLGHQAPACVTVTEVDQSPFWMYRLDTSRHLVPLIEQQRIPDRRQDLSPVYILNGAVYVAQTAWLHQQRTFLTSETVAHIMPRERSLDVDTEFDLQICESLKSWSRTSMG